MNILSLKRKALGHTLRWGDTDGGDNGYGGYTGGGYGTDGSQGYGGGDTPSYSGGGMDYGYGYGDVGEYGAPAPAAPAVSPQQQAQNEADAAAAAAFGMSLNDYRDIAYEAGAAPALDAGTRLQAAYTPGGTWSIGTDGNVYGNLQDAAAAIGMKPSQLPGNSLPGWMAALSPSLAMAVKGIGYAQDSWGLPGYAMTAAERDAMSASRSSGGNSQRAFGVASTMSGGDNNVTSSLLDQITGAFNHDASNSAQTGWDRWLNVDQPWLDGQTASATTRGNAGYDAFTLNADNADQDYNGIFRPAYGKMADYVDQLGSEDYRAQQRAQAMEGVDAQFGMQDQALQRRYAGMGMGSGALADALAGQSANRAMAKVAAATNSDNTLQKTYGDALGTLASTGLKVADYGSTARKNGIAAGLSGAELGLNTAKAGMSAAQTTGQILDSRTNAAANTQAAATGVMNANTSANHQAAADNPWTTIGGALIGGLAKTDNFSKAATGLIGSIFGSI